MILVHNIHMNYLVNYLFQIKFVKNFDSSKYGQKLDYGCFLLCEVKTTDKIRNDPLYSQCPMLLDAK